MREWGHPLKATCQEKIVLRQGKALGSGLGYWDFMAWNREGRLPEVAQGREDIGGQAWDIGILDHP
jgi:hypothetical protein